MDKTAMGKRIQKYRTKAGYTQEQLAEVLDCSSSFITAIERGIRLPSLSSLIELAEVLDVSTDMILGVRRKSCENPQLAYLDEEIAGLTVEAQKSLFSMMEVMIEYMKEMDKILDTRNSGIFGAEWADKKKKE